MEFIELKPFRKFLKTSRANVKNFKALKQELSETPEKGDSIPYTGGVRKIRMALPNTGKSGGARIIYFYVKIENIIFLITGYEKSTQDDLTSDQKKSMRALVKKLEEQTGDIK